MIKLLRLVTGEWIVSEVKEKDTTLVLIEPRMLGASQDKKLILGGFIPFGVVDRIEIETDKVFGSTKLIDGDLHDFYKEAVSPIDLPSQKIIV